MRCHLHLARPGLFRTPLVPATSCLHRARRRGDAGTSIPRLPPGNAGCNRSLGRPGYFLPERPSPPRTRLDAGPIKPADLLTDLFLFAYFDARSRHRSRQDQPLRQRALGPRPAHRCAWRPSRSGLARFHRSRTIQAATEFRRPVRHRSRSMARDSRGRWSTAGPPRNRTTCSSGTGQDPSVSRSRWLSGLRRWGSGTEAQRLVGCRPCSRVGRRGRRRHHRQV